MHILDFVDAASRQGRLVQVIKVRMCHGLTCRDPLGRIVGQHFLKQRKMTKPTIIVTIIVVIEICNKCLIVLFYGIQH